VTESISAPVSETQSDDSFDRVRLLQLVDGDKALLSEIVGLFFEDAPMWLDAVRDAGAVADGELLRSSAHALKGALSNFAADRATSIASTLEEKGRAEELEGVRELIADLELEMVVLSRDLRILVAES